MYRTLQQQMTITGIIQTGIQPGCIILLGDNGITYDLKNISFNVPAPGTRVTVTGVARPDMVSNCQQGVPFATTNIVTSAPLYPTYPATFPYAAPYPAYPYAIPFYPSPVFIPQVFASPLFVQRPMFVIQMPEQHITAGTTPNIR